MGTKRVELSATHHTDTHTMPEKVQLSETYLNIYFTSRLSRIGRVSVLQYVLFSISCPGLWESD